MSRLCWKGFWNMLDKCLADNDPWVAGLALERGNGTSILPRIAILALWFCDCILINENQLIPLKSQKKCWRKYFFKWISSQSKEWKINEPVSLTDVLAPPEKTQVCSKCSKTARQALTMVVMGLQSSVNVNRDWQKGAHFLWLLLPLSLLPLSLLLSHSVRRTS